ncbi:MAG: DNA alkylation repair protein [Thermoplasmata archaeon M9B1D]|nr:MAG: DNA alkylation repair protein [Thermoplasmata archaeon M9B1D]PNX50595.1 MAG: DNA alkylation repair protein [Thermoplasmata archaeon M8B2D]
MQYEKLLKKLKSMEKPENVEGMARYGINPKNNLGISIYKLRPIAKEIGKNHDLALKLWNSGIHDARLLACFIDDPKKVTSKQMDLWAYNFDSWDICDQACTSLFDLTPLAWEKILEWSKHEKEFVKRGAFSLIAGLAVHDKNANDKMFEKLFPIIIRESNDDRNYVKKAVNWALRNIGKRNKVLNKKAIETAKNILEIDSKTARWIANDVIRELTSEKVLKRFEKKT